MRERVAAWSPSAQTDARDGAHHALRQALSRPGFKDSYQMLGVPLTAKADDIKKAYRKLARQHHPDVSKSADANERMVALTEASAVLSDPTKRLAYDSFVAGGDTPEGTDFSPPPHWDTGFEFSDGQADKAERSSFFEQLFGRAARSSRKQGKGKHFSDAMQGNDHHARSRCTS